MLEFEYQSMNEPFVPARWREAYEYKPMEIEERTKKKMPRFFPLIYRSKTHQFIAPLCDKLCYSPEYSPGSDQVLTWDKIFTTLSDKLCHCYRIPPYTQQLEPGCISVFNLCDSENNATTESNWNTSRLHDNCRMCDYNLVMFHDPNFAEFVNDGLEARTATISRHITTMTEGYGFSGYTEDVHKQRTATEALREERRKMRKLMEPQDFDHLMYGYNLTRKDYFGIAFDISEDLGFYTQFIWRGPPKTMAIAAEDGTTDGTTKRDYEPFRFDKDKIEFRAGRTNRQIEKKSEAYRSSLARAASRRGGPSRGK